MQILRTGDRNLIRLVTGEEVMDVLRGLARSDSLPSATFIALGAVNEVTLAAFDPVERRYLETPLNEPLEMAAVVGNISWLPDGEPLVHAHGVFSRFDCTTVAGHIMRAVVSATCEISMKVGKQKVNRQFDEAVGLNLLDLPD